MVEDKISKLRIKHLFELEISSEIYFLITSCLKWENADLERWLVKI
jgi:hypothetical protein